MSVLAVADLSPHRVPSTRRARLRSVPADPASSVTVTITLGKPGSEQSERVLAALRDLVVAAGPGAGVVLNPEAGPAISPAAAGLRLVPRSRTATLDGSALDLSRLEYDLLHFLARHPRQVFTRNQLLGHVWGHTHTTVRTVDVHVSRLRTKLGNPDIVTTVYGVGYRLTDESPIAIDEE